MGSLALASAFQAPSGGFLRAPTKASTALATTRKGEVTMNYPAPVRKKVVITGVGAVSPLGWGDDFWNGLIEGRSGIVRLPSWADEYPAKVGGSLAAGLLDDERRTDRPKRFRGTHLIQSFMPD